MFHSFELLLMPNEMKIFETHFNFKRVKQSKDAIES